VAVRRPQRRRARILSSFHQALPFPLYSWEPGLHPNFSDGLDELLKGKQSWIVLDTEALRDQVNLERLQSLQAFHLPLDYRYLVFAVHPFDKEHRGLPLLFHLSPVIILRVEEGFAMDGIFEAGLIYWVFEHRRLPLRYKGNS